MFHSHVKLPEGNQTDDVGVPGNVIDHPKKKNQNMS
jgi:hypothetical protein